jgi:cytochrome c-type biogenesis protein CcmH/NrfG
MGTTKKDAALAKTSWAVSQAYFLAAVCLVVGIALGYLFRGSASPVAANAATSVSGDGTAGQTAQAQLTAEQQKAMMEKAVAPLLEASRAKPNDFDTMVQLANLYYDGRQYGDAIKYYQLAIKSQPTNADVLTDLGTAMWYQGDADGAIAEFQAALKYRPDHPGTLFNLGIVRWQGKLDPKGAVEAWEQLLKLNPDYPQRQQVQEYIDRAKQHAKS